MSNSTDAVIEQSDLMNNLKTGVTSPRVETTSPKIEINSPEEVKGENEGNTIKSPSIADTLKNMQLDDSNSSWITTSDTSSRAGGRSLGTSQSSYISCSSSSSSTGSTDDSYYSSSNYCSCSSCSDCGGCKCSCNSDQSSISFESTDDLTKKPRGKVGSPINNKEAEEINERCSQS